MVLHPPLARLQLPTSPMPGPHYTYLQHLQPITRSSKPARDTISSRQCASITQNRRGTHSIRLLEPPLPILGRPQSTKHTCRSRFPTSHRQETPNATVAPLRHHYKTGKGSVYHY